MNNTSKFANFIIFWTKFVEKKRSLIIIAIIALTIASLFCIKSNLGFSTNTADMLSEKLHWRQLDIEYERLFPQFLDNILIVIEAETPDLASDTAKEIHSAINIAPDILQDIY